MIQTEKSLKAHADRAAKMLRSALPENVYYLLVVTTQETDEGPMLIWNTNMDPQKEAAAVFRSLADDLEENGSPPLLPIDG